MQMQRKVLLAQDGEGNPNHSKEDGRFVSGNKIYGSAEHAIKASNEEAKKSGKITAVEAYDPEKHPTATLATKSFPTDRSKGTGPISPSTGRPERESVATTSKKNMFGESPDHYQEGNKDFPSEQKYKSELATEQGRKNHRSIAAAFNNGQSKKIGNYSTDGKAIYLHGNKIVEKGENGEINFTLAGWPTNTTRSSLRDFGINVSTKAGKQNYTHSGGTEEIDSNTMYRAKDEQPDMALDPNSAAVNSPTPWKGRNLDNDPVGDRSASPDVGSGAAGATWNGRTLD